MSPGRPPGAAVPLLSCKLPRGAQQLCDSCPDEVRAEPKWSRGGYRGL